MLLDGPVLEAIARGAAVLGAGGGGETGTGLLHATNAVLEHRALRRVAVLRIGSPATHAVRPLFGWPNALAVAVSAGEVIDPGGFEFDGREIVPFDGETVRRFLGSLAPAPAGVAITGVFSEIVHNPQHPYTKALMSVVPKPDPRSRGRREILKGETPNPIHVPAGCRFHPRCPIAQNVCTATDPELRPTSAGATPEHRSACLFT